MKVFKFLVGLAVVVGLSESSVIACEAPGSMVRARHENPQVGPTSPRASQVILSNTCPPEIIPPLPPDEGFISGNTCTSTNDFENDGYDCDYGWGGPDEIFQFTVEASGLWQIDTSNPCAGWDTSLMVREELGGGCPGDFLACDGDSGHPFCGNLESVIQVILVTGSTYYLVVDGSGPADCGPFDVWLFLLEPLCTDDGDCDDEEWCNGAEWCDPQSVCQPGIGPCEPHETCDEDADVCVEPDPCISWLGGTVSEYFFPYADFTAGAWIADDIELERTCTDDPAVLEHYEFQMFGRDVAGDPLGTSYSIDMALWTVAENTCLPLEPIAGSQCSGLSGTIQPPGSPPDVMYCAPGPVPLPDNSGNFTRCEIDFFIGYLGTTLGSGFVIGGEQQIIGGPAGDDDFGVSVIALEDFPGANSWHFEWFGNDLDSPGDFANATVCTDNVGVCCEGLHVCTEATLASDCPGDWHPCVIWDPPACEDPDGDGAYTICGDNCPDHYNPGQEDCDCDGIGDVCAIAQGYSQDCQPNLIPDECDIDPSDPDGNGEVSADCNSNLIPDECDIDPTDPDGNGVASNDCNNNSIPDECDIWAMISPDAENVILGWSDIGAGNTDHYHIWRAIGDIGGPYVLWHDTSGDLDPLTTTWTDVGAGWDNLSYFYIVDSVESSGATAGAECLIAAKLSYFLEPEECEWVLVSFPLIQRDEGILEVLNTVHWNAAEYYYGMAPPWEHWLTYSIDKPPWLNDLLFLNHRMGFWLRVTGPDIDWQIAGTVPTTTAIRGGAGWNMMGYPYFDPPPMYQSMTVGEFKDMVNAQNPTVNVLRVEAWDPSEPYCIGLLEDADPMEHGWGYWVQLDGPATIAFTNTIEVDRADVDIELVVRNVEGGIDSTETLPESASTVSAGDNFVVEVWATDSGDENTGLAGVFVDLAFDPGVVQALSVDHRAPFTFLPDGDIDNVGGTVTDLGGVDADFTCVGVEPEWVRLAVVGFDALGTLDTAEFTTGASSLEIGVCGRETKCVGYGAATVDIEHNVYDLTGDCFIDAGDLGLFAVCWGCCEGEPCWEEYGCADKDFDCNGCVATGDLGWFAAGWEKACDEIPREDWPPCRRPGRGAPRGETSDDGEVLIRWDTVASRQGNEGPAKRFPLYSGYRAGDQLDVGLWVRDDTASSRGLTAVYVDLTFDPAEVLVNQIDHGSTYTLFASGEVGGRSIGRLGGATLEPGVAVGAWTRFASVRMTARGDLPRGPRLRVQPAYDGVAGLGRGTIPADQVRVIGTQSFVTSENPPRHQSGASADRLEGVRSLKPKF